MKKLILALISLNHILAQEDVDFDKILKTFEEEQKKKDPNFNMEDFMKNMGDMAKNANPDDIKEKVSTYAKEQEEGVKSKLKSMFRDNEIPLTKKELDNLWKYVKESYLKDGYEEFKLSKKVNKFLKSVNAKAEWFYKEFETKVKDVYEQFLDAMETKDNEPASGDKSDEKEDKSEEKNKEEDEDEL